MKIRSARFLLDIPGTVTLATVIWLCTSASIRARMVDKKADAYMQGQSQSGGERISEFKLRDTTGHEVSSAQFRGKVVLLDF
jgi:hypothetical protein